MNTQMVAQTGQKTIVETVNVEALVSEWLAALDCSEDTRTAYRLGMGKFLDWLADNGLEATAATIRQWRDGLKGQYSAATVNVRLSAVRSFYAWADDQGRIAINPAAGVKGAKRRGTSKAHKRDELTAGEIRAILAECDPNTPTGARDRALVALMAYTGVRSVEAHRADVGDIRTKDGRLVLWVHGKNRDAKDDFVVLPEGALVELRRWLAIRPGQNGDPLFVSLSHRNAGQRMSRPAIRAAVKARFKAAGVVGDLKTTHSLRHSAISTAIRGGATPTQAQAMARHSNINTTMIYYHEVNRTQNPAEDLISY